MFIRACSTNDVFRMHEHNYEIWKNGCIETITDQNKVKQYDKWVREAKRFYANDQDATLPLDEYVLRYIEFMENEI